MKKQYHICITSHNEVIFRNEFDYLKGINSLALSCVYTGEKIGTFSLQSDHIHFDLFSDNPGEFVRIFKNGYFQYFNRKYIRTGSLGEHMYYHIELDGARHIEAAESYILRNAVHHGVALSPFGYPFNSSNCYFCNDLGHTFLSAIDFKKYKKGAFLPHNRRFPKDYLMNPQGIIAPEYFIEISLVEKFFGSPRGFNYCMTRLSSEEWSISQSKDENGLAPITLQSIEKPYSDQLDLMYEYEKARRSTMRTDTEVCALIDTKYLKKYHCQSYTQLTEDQKSQIICELLPQKGFTKAQLYRCLAVKR